MSDSVHRLTGRSIVAAYLESALMLAGSLAAGVLYLSNPDLWPGAWAWLALGPLILVTLIEPVWRWAFTRVEVTPAHVRVSRGFISLSERTLAWSDLGACDVRQSWACRWLGIHELTLAQTGDERTKLQLPGLSSETKATILDHVDRSRSTRSSSVEGVPSTQRHAEEEPIRIAPIFRARVGELLLASLSYGQFAMLGAAAALTLVDLLDAAGVLGWLEEEVAVAPLPAAVAVGVAILALGFVLTVVRYANFEVGRRSDGSLQIAYGWVSTHTRSIDSDAVVGVVLQRNLIESALGRVRLALLTTDSVAQLGGNLVLPSLPRAVVDRVVRESFPDFSSAVGLAGRAPLSAFRQLSIVAVTAVVPIAVWALCAPAASPAMTAAAVGVAAFLSWTFGKMFCSQLRFAPSEHLATHLTAHITERHRIVTVDALHAGSTSMIGRWPVLVSAYFVAGTPRALRAFRFDPAHIAEMELQLAAARNPAARRGLVIPRERASCGDAGGLGEAQPGLDDRVGVQ